MDALSGISRGLAIKMKIAQHASIGAGYTHNKIRYWTYGPNAFTLFRWLLDGVVIVLIIYVVRTFNTPAQPQCEIAAPETDADSGGRTEP